MSARCLTPCNGGCTFAENPSRAAPEARIIWHADLDPGTLRVIAVPCPDVDPDGIDAERLAPWLAFATDAQGREHAVLSDGWHHIRLDVDLGSIASNLPVRLHYRIIGLVSAEPKLLPLRRLIDLCRRGRFARSLFPRDPRVDRWLVMLRVHDAVTAGASHREIAQALFGAARVAADWTAPSDALRSSIRRLVRGADLLAGGGYRWLLSARP